MENKDYDKLLEKYLDLKAKYDNLLKLYEQTENLNFSMTSTEIKEPENKRKTNDNVEVTWENDKIVNFNMFE